MESVLVQQLHNHPIDTAIIRVYYSGRRFKKYTLEKRASKQAFYVGYMRVYWLLASGKMETCRQELRHTSGMWSKQTL
jgi:hypothetical protein